MSESTRNLTVFYSWQSDLPDSTNRSAIRQALRSAANEIEQKITGIRVSIDEATREEPGSPNIPATILRKIEEADAFVADVSIVNGGPPSENVVRPMPNPNVVFELGYAVAQLGWGRIVLLFNEEFGLLNQLPFDFDRHRVSPYRLTQTSNGQQRRSVASLAEVALTSVLKADPPRPAATRVPSGHEIRRSRDLRNLERVLSKVHIPSLEAHMEEDPHRILHIIHFCWLDFDAEMSSSQMHFYDRDLDARLRAFHKAWARSMSYPSEYHPDATPIIRAFIFMEYDDPFQMLKGNRQKHWDEMQAGRTRMAEVWPQIAKLVQEKYLELDMRELSKAREAEYTAWREKLYQI